MINQIQDFVSEQKDVLVDQFQKLRSDSVESVREAALGSAESLKSLKAPVRVIARSGVKLTTVSQTTVANLIELQSDVVTAALTDAALRLQRASRAENVVELVREQFEMLPATRDRIVEEAQRAVAIFADAGRELKDVAVHAYESVTDSVEEKAPVKKAKRTVKRAARKTAQRVRKVAEVVAE
jgi:hypothetical protein